MPKCNNIYNRFQRYVKNKDIAVNFFVNSTLSKTQSMFIYNGLPKTIPPYEFERQMQTKGFSFVTKVNGDLYCFTGGLCGLVDAYNVPKDITVCNVGLNISETYTHFENKDGVLCRNDYQMRGLMPILGKYAVLRTDAEISLNTVAVLSRLTMLISASDEKTRQSADMFIEKILDGDFSVISENAFLSGVKFQQSNNANGNHITELIELNQYYKSNLLAEIGLNSQFNMKRERLTENEVLLNVDEILPFVDNMLQCRRAAVDAINEKYGTEITVDLNTAWKTEKENNDKTVAMTETETAAETETAETPETDETETNENETETKPTETPETDETETEKIVETIRKMREDETEKDENNEKDA